MGYLEGGEELGEAAGVDGGAYNLLVVVLRVLLVMLDLFLEFCLSTYVCVAFQQLDTYAL